MILIFDDDDDYYDDNEKLNFGWENECKNNKSENVQYFTSQKYIILKKK